MRAANKARAGRARPSTKKTMPFMGHLTELRRRLIFSGLAVLAGCIVCFFFSGPLYDFLAAAITPLLPAGSLVYTGPADPVLLYVKISLIAGLFVSSPFILLQLWLFIAPGLKAREKRIALAFLAAAALLFSGGGMFAYLIALPVSLKFLLSVAGPFQPMITINGYFDLALAVILGSGLVFEIPVLVFFLSALGIVSGKFLLKRFHYAVFVIALAAAVITPTTDMVTMVVFMAPMVALYAVGVLVAFIFGKKEKSED